MSVKLFGIKKFDTQNGPGIRMSIWLSGCSNKCKECWSKETWDKNYGFELKDKLNEIKDILKDKHFHSVSILGGDPFYHLFNHNKDETKEIYDLFNLLKKHTDDIWVWTGYDFEEVKKKFPDILSYIKVLVDGRFEIEKKDLRLKWKGSSNQRVIDVQKTLEESEIILYE